MSVNLQSSNPLEPGPYPQHNRRTDGFDLQSLGSALRCAAVRGVVGVRDTRDERSPSLDSRSAEEIHFTLNGSPFDWSRNNTRRRRVLFLMWPYHDMPPNSWLGQRLRLLRHPLLGFAKSGPLQ